jgi:hypothetical protein
MNTPYFIFGIFVGSLLTIRFIRKAKWIEAIVIALMTCGIFSLWRAFFQILLEL